MAAPFSKLSDPLRQLLCILLILLPLMLLGQVCEAEKPFKTLCGTALETMLFSVCKNGFNKKDLGKYGTNYLRKCIQNTVEMSFKNSWLIRNMLIGLLFLLFSAQMTDGTLGLPRSRRHADLLLLPLKFKKKFEQEASATLRRGIRHPSLKQTLREEARWRRRLRITGKRVRRQQPFDIRVVDECCSTSCPKSEIARYCMGLL